jgi:hypothetical protein
VNQLASLMIQLKLNYLRVPKSSDSGTSFVYRNLRTVSFFHKKIERLLLCSFMLLDKYLPDNMDKKF